MFLGVFLGHFCFMFSASIYPIKSTEDVGNKRKLVIPAKTRKRSSKYQTHASGLRYGVETVTALTTHWHLTTSFSDPMLETVLPVVAVPPMERGV